MTAKRRRRPSRPKPAAAGRPSDGTETAPTETDEAASSGASAGARAPTTTGRRGFASVPSPYPPFAQSVGAGLRAAGSSPGVLVVAFLGELAMWGMFQVLDAPTPAGALAGLMGLPPVHLVFEVPVARSLGSAAAQVGMLLAVVAIRAVILALLCLQLLDGLRGRPHRVLDTVGRLPRVWAAMAQFYVLEVAAVLAAPLVLGLLGPQFVGVGTILVMILGLQFLIMAPVIIAAEDVPAGQAVRWSFRAARLPGLRHFGLVLTYFFLAFSVLIPASGFGLQPVTPGILVWSFALAVTYLHVGVLGAFAYRWLAVRNEPAFRPEPSPQRDRGGDARVGTGARSGSTKPKAGGGSSGGRSRRSGKRKRRR